VFTGNSAGAAEERLPVTKRVPILVMNEDGLPEPGWTVAALGETGIDVVQTRTGRLRGLTWEEVFEVNPAFDIDALLAEDVPTAPAQAAPTGAFPSPSAPQPARAPAAPELTTPAPAPGPSVPSAPPPPFKLAPGRGLAIPDGNGGLAPGRWEAASVDAEGVTAVAADGETTCRLTWGSVLRANPDFLPPTSRVLMEDGRRGTVIAYEGDLVTIAAANAYQDASLGLRSHAFVGHQYTEPLDVFAERNASVIG
jgi:hypothetical protein